MKYFEYDADSDPMFTTQVYLTHVEKTLVQLSQDVRDEESGGMLLGYIHALYDLEITDDFHNKAMLEAAAITIEKSILREAAGDAIARKVTRL